MGAGRGRWERGEKRRVGRERKGARGKYTSASPDNFSPLSTASISRFKLPLFSNGEAKKWANLKYTADDPSDQCIMSCDVIEFM